MRPILSICIPTYNRVDILRNTIDSIYRDVDDNLINEFEVVVTDNSKEHATQSLMKEYDYSNLHYYITSCEGFKNSFYALAYGKGEYLKLNNNYTMFQQGTLKAIVHYLKSIQSTKSPIIYTNGLLFYNRIIEYKSLDDYMYGLSYFCSWSAGYGMWKEDFDKIKNRVLLDKYFPQTSLLLTQDYKNSFIINDLCLFKDQHIPRKGGYNIFKVFSVDLLNLLIGALEKGTISESTYRRIKNELLYKYLSVRYFKTAIAKLDNFEKSNIKENITIHYSCRQYYGMIVVALFAPIINIYRKTRRLLFENIAY